MKSKIIKLGEKEIPIRIWVGKDGFYIEYLKIKNYDLGEKDMDYLTKIPPQNWQQGTPVFFAYLKDIVAYALKYIQFLNQNKKLEDITNISVETTSAKNNAGNKFF